MSGVGNIFNKSTPEEIRYLDDLERKAKRLQALIDQLTTFPGFASQSEAETGTAEDKAMNALRTSQAIAALNPWSRIFHARDHKSDGTNGGTFTGGAWRTIS